MATEKQQTMAETDTPLSKAADLFLKAKQDVGDAKEAQAEAEEALIVEMRKVGKTTLRHGEKTLRLEEIEKERIVVDR